MNKKCIYAIASVIIWSTLAPFTKSLLGAMTNFQILFICSMLASAFLLTVNIVTGNIKNIRNYKPKDIAIMAGLGFLGLFVYKALYNVGLENLTSQQACVINYLWPIMIVIFSCIILREKMTVMKAVAMLCSFAGIIILTSGVDVSGSEGNAVMGIVGCAVAAACYGLYSVLNKKVNYDLKLTMMIAWLTAAAFSLPLGLIFEDWGSIGVSAIPAVLWLGIFGDGVAYLTWAMALSGKGSTATVANLAYLTPFLSLVVSMIVLNEPLDGRAVIALVFIVGGILLQSFAAGKKMRKDKLK